MRKLAAILATSTLALTACASANHRYDSATELRSAAVNAGLHCTGYNPAQPPEGAASAGACVGGTPAQFVVYSDDDAAKRGVESARTGLEKGQGLLAGPNWYVVSRAKDVSDIKDAVGGEIKH